MICVSFIGIDKKTDIDRLLKIAEKYPEVEFGFLCSDSVTGTNQNNRYPPLILLQQLKNKNKNINLSLHVCGRLARTVCQTGNFDEVKKFVGAYFDMFDRIQLNVVGSRFKELITDTCGKQIVIQTNLSEPKSKETYEKFIAANIDNIVFLSDNSGGIDVDFDYFEGLDYQGFAGGLNPENILERKEEIDILWEKDYWLDMESGVRTDDWFDLDKVEDICKKVLGER